MKKLLLGIVLSVIAFSANAITFNETTSPRLDPIFQSSGANTHWDTSLDGLEWLDFGDNSGNDVTFGWSLNNAANAYSVDGFRLATETEVFNLFELFFPTFVDSGNGAMTVAESVTADLIQERNSWGVAFGTDVPINGGVFNERISSLGMYLADNGTLQLAGARLDPTLPDTTTLFSTAFTVSGLDANTGYSNLGVFMVRDYVPAVPVPAAAWLMLSGLLGLAAVARRKA